ncbi:carboxymuconolactone decarboxylase family protein [Propionicicella superfundia]|uniref:carboxymuconolactone decarboxylase family protein n=1 Tax=Propionicicella superfundia TaxID=348582 RepID=UPI00040D6454|nr:carboxymuconolactone decarboxylase family protein [Propionicicella superfundia]
MSVSNGFLLFGEQFPQTAQAHMAFVQAEAQESALDEKTGHLAYLAVLAATGMSGGIPFHVRLARESGASREEVLSACLSGLPAVGLTVLDGLAAAADALNGEADE